MNLKIAAFYAAKGKVMAFYGEWERVLDQKCRLEFPAKVVGKIGRTVLLASAKSGGIKILPRFRPPRGQEAMFCEAEVKPHRASYSSRMLIGEDARRQFHLRRIGPRRRVILKGCGDHIELYPAGSR